MDDVRRVLVIFGAGASNDSIAPENRLGDQAWRPPLAANLFANDPNYVEIINRFPAIRPVVSDLRATAGVVAVEQELQRLSDEGEKYPRRLNQLMAVRYYLQDLLWASSQNWSRGHAGVSNYVRLVDNLENWRSRAEDRSVVYATFNYDTLLDQAMNDVLRFRPAGMNDYIDPRWGLFKLHGSVNWGQAIAIPNALIGSGGRPGGVEADPDRQCRSLRDDGAVPRHGQP
jgi:hypothetical protein